MPRVDHLQRMEAESIHILREVVAECDRPVMLYSVGKLLIVTLLGGVARHSAYGLAGSFLVLMLWVYYSVQIFLLGAEFTCRFAYAHGSRIGRTLGAARA